MSDDADFAAELAAVEIAAGLSRIDRAIPAGAPGECDDCGEVMPRLVGGRCGYCRDGRRPPLSRYDAPAPPVPASLPPATTMPQDCKAMPTLPNTADRHTISVVATGAVLAAIRARAEGDELPLGQAAVALMTDGLEALADLDAPKPEPATFQQRVSRWMIETFGEDTSADRIERNHRFLEEALELVQSRGCTSAEAQQLVDYVFGRATGEPAQEVGGVMVTLAALCNASAIELEEAAEAELARVWTKMEAIRAKQAAKPRFSPLPQIVERPTTIDLSSVPIGLLTTEISRRVEAAVDYDLAIARAEIAEAKIAQFRAVLA